MPRKISKRKQIQAARLKAEAIDQARKHRLWPGARRLPSKAPQEPQQPRRVGMIAHQSSGIGLAIAALVAAGMFAQLPSDREGEA